MAKLKSLTLLKTHRGISPFTLKFKDGLNVIVGENGSGKSSILKLLTEEPGSGVDGGPHKKLIRLDHEPGVNFRFLDTEKCNPRLKTDLEQSKSIEFEIGSHFVSHGEAMLPLILAAEGFKDIVLFIDEPEAGISLKNQKKVIETLKKIVIKNACQVIVTTHSYVIIKNVDEIFCMDTKKWMSSDAYLFSSVGK